MWNISWTMLLLSKRLLRKLGVDDTKEIFCFTAATLVSVFAWNAEAALSKSIRKTGCLMTIFSKLATQ